jgi:lipid-A-disaccharide synthase
VKTQIALVAGELSGDILGAFLLRALYQYWPRLKTYGIGGQNMQATGFDPGWSYDRLAVHGYTDALKRLPSLWYLRQTLKKRLIEKRPQVFIGIDAPDFNLGLERHLKQAGIKTIHFISPSIWAWRGKRIHKIKQSVDHMLCVFPFERAIYDQAEIPSTYVGHPLASILPMEPKVSTMRSLLGLDQGRPALAILPGSRLGEIQRITPPFLQAVKILKHRIPELQFILPAIPTYKTLLQTMLRQAGLESTVICIAGKSQEVLSACDVALLASGTATLEAMLCKKPMVIAYVTSMFSALVMRRIGYLPWVGLPNILARETLVPELLQEQVTPKALADHVQAWFDSVQKVKVLKQRFTEIHRQLQCNTPERVCRTIASVIHQ